MFCKWCGMESATTDVCSWCHHTLTETAPKVEETTRSTEPNEMNVPGATKPGTGEIGLAAGVTAFAASEMVAPVEPQTTAPVAGTPPGGNTGTEGKRPIIGVKRPGSSRTNPAPMAPVVPRSAGTGTLEPRNPAPAVSPNTPPIAAKPVPPVPVTPPTVSARQEVNQSAPVPAAPIQPKRVEVKPKTTSTEINKPKSDSGELEDVGLAAGLSAPSHLSATPTNGTYAPALGTFEAQNSKYLHRAGRRPGFRERITIRQRVR